MSKMRYLIVVIALFATVSCGEEKVVINIETHIKNHRFYPDRLKLKENQVLRLSVYNDDPTVEEFESFDLKREKIVPGNKKIVVTMGPLKKGVYEFFGEFNMDTAKGKIIVE